MQSYLLVMYVFLFYSIEEIIQKQTKLEILKSFLIDSRDVFILWNSKNNISLPSSVCLEVLQHG